MSLAHRPFKYVNCCLRKYCYRAVGAYACPFAEAVSLAQTPCASSERSIKSILVKAETWVRWGKGKTAFSTGPEGFSVWGEESNCN